MGFLLVGVAGAIVLQSALAFQAVSVPDLLVYWRFDETASPAADSSGNSHSGTWEFSPVSSTSVPPIGPPGISFTNPNSLSFDGVNTRVTNATFSHPTGGPVTVAFWNFVADVQTSTAFTVGLQDNPNRFMAHAPWSDLNVYWDYGDWTNGGRITASYTRWVK